MIHRMWYIDVGVMPAHKAYAYVEKYKNEIEQKKSRKDKKKYIDYFFAHYEAGGSRLEIIETTQ